MSSLAYLAECKAQRMPYWDRAKVAKEQGLTFRVYVPKEGALKGVAKGSAIVGVAEDGMGPERTLVYYEGSIYGPERPYEVNVYHAADRMAVDYPTVARALVLVQDLVHVGYFDYATQKLLITDQEALDAWRA